MQKYCGWLCVFANCILCTVGAHPYVVDNKHFPQCSSPWSCALCKGQPVMFVPLRLSRRDILWGRKKRMHAYAFHRNAWCWYTVLHEAYLWHAGKLFGYNATDETFLQNEKPVWKSKAIFVQIALKRNKPQTTDYALGLQSDFQGNTGKKICILTIHRIRVICVLSG